MLHVHLLVSIPHTGVELPLAFLCLIHLYQLFSPAVLFSFLSATLQLSPFFVHNHSRLCLIKGCLPPFSDIHSIGVKCILGMFHVRGCVIQNKNNPCVAGYFLSNSVTALCTWVISFSFVKYPSVWVSSIKQAFSPSYSRKPLSYSTKSETIMETFDLKPVWNHLSSEMFDQHNNRKLIHHGILESLAATTNLELESAMSTFWVCMTRVFLRTCFYLLLHHRVHGRQSTHPLRIACVQIPSHVATQMQWKYICWHPSLP